MEKVAGSGNTIFNARLLSRNDEVGVNNNHIEEGIGKISPVEASQRYLIHLREAWNETHPAEPFDSQQVLVTVPASFDEVARELTLKAAGQAGYRITLAGGLLPSGEARPPLCMGQRVLVSGRAPLPLAQRLSGAPAAFPRGLGCSTL